MKGKGPEGKRLEGWSRSRKSSKYLSRQVAIKDQLPYILVVCEGKKTEPQYFESFRVPSLRLSIIPAGRIHISVVEKGADEVRANPDYDEVWCVFDRDKNSKNKDDVQQFNDALDLARKNNFKVAYSNDAFELWYLLHFIYFDSQISRADYIDKLSKYIPGGYRKNDPEIYKKLENKMNVAIKRAKKLYDAAKNIKPVHADPSTTVFELVETLRKYSHK